ncbi:MAG: ATP-dependent Clp protease adaptor ClpS [Holophagaceae bacterium]|nr:ATP-dependent Clp protease adaptor ClpS [Holophagaceae bacterium]
MSQPIGSTKILTGTETDVSERIQLPRQYRVVLHNDNFTTRDFVVYILQEIFRKSEADAVGIMLSVHNKGIGVAGVYSFQVAETKVEQVRQLAERHEFPLLCTCEPDN